AAVAGGPSQRGAVRGFAFAEQQVVGLSLDPLAMVEAKSLGAGTPPASRRFTAAFAGLDVVTGGVLRRAVVDVFPDVLQVVTLAQRRYTRHYALRLRKAGVAELPILIRWCMGVTFFISMPSRVTKRSIKIRNEKRT